jgi:hypothetical protein
MEVKAMLILDSTIKKRLLEATNKEYLGSLIRDEISSAWLDQKTRLEYQKIGEANEILLRIAKIIFNSEILPAFQWSIAHLVYGNRHSFLFDDSKDVAIVMFVYFTKNEVEEYLNEINKSILGNGKTDNYHSTDKQF